MLTSLQLILRLPPCLRIQALKHGIPSYNTRLYFSTTPNLLRYQKPRAIRKPPPSSLTKPQSAMPSQSDTSVNGLRTPANKPRASSPAAEISTPSDYSVPSYSLDTSVIPGPPTSPDSLSSPAPGSRSTPPLSKPHPKNTPSPPLPKPHPRNANAPHLYARTLLQGGSSSLLYLSPPHRSWYLTSWLLGSSLLFGAYEWALAAGQFPVMKGWMGWVQGFSFWVGTVGVGLAGAWLLRSPMGVVRRITLFASRGAAEAAQAEREVEARRFWKWLRGSSGTGKSAISAGAGAGASATTGTVSPAAATARLASGRGGNEPVLELTIKHPLYFLHSPNRRTSGEKTLLLPLTAAHLTTRITAQSTNLKWHSIPLGSADTFTRLALSSAPATLGLDAGQPTTGQPQPSIIARAARGFWLDVRRICYREGLGYVSFEGKRWKIDLQGCAILESGKPLRVFMMEGRKEEDEVGGLVGSWMRRWVGG